MIEEWLSSPAAHPEARRAIEALAPALREELDRRLEPIDLHAGEILFARGDPRDAVFLILRGRISVTGQSAMGGDLPVRVLSPGDGVGEIGLAAHGPHTTSAQALDDARVLRLTRMAFERICEEHPQAMSGLADFITPAAHAALLARVLCDLLGERDAAQLEAVMAEVECLELKSGDVLFSQGEVSDRMFIVLYGRLRTVIRDAGGMETIVDEAGCGDTLGQRSLLAREVHSTTVCAVRDSAVGVITRSLFVSLQYQYPEMVVRLARIASRRLQASAARRPAAPQTTHVASIAVLPMGAPRGGVPLAAFAERLASALSAIATTLHLSSARLEGLLSTPGIARVDPQHPSAPMLAAWLHQQEQSYSCVIYEADDAWTPWTERCLRMSDRVLLVGLGGTAPLPTELDEPLARLSDSTRTELVLLQPDGISRPSGTAAWLDRYPAAGHDHVRLRRQSDFDRFVRHITGRGLGLVLGGGAARGFAHIGVFRALAECGVEVDLVGGTSMGAVLGATFAMGLGYRETLELARQLASPLKLFDPTIPAVSFFGSGKVTRVLEHIYGDTQIEDLWMPCFCVSSNLTRAVAVVHRRGRLWQAVRASMAIPGVFSPILADGDLLVDGCVLDNLPIEVMQRVSYGGPIIAVNVFPDVDLLRDYDFGPSVSGWRTLASSLARRANLNPFARRDDPPLIFESLVRVLALNSVHLAKNQRGLVDVYIQPPVESYNLLDFGAYARIAEIGYHSALEALGDWEALRSREGAPRIGAPVETASGLAAAGQLPGDSITVPLHKTLSELDELLRRLERPSSAGPAELTPAPAAPHGFHKVD